MNLIEIDVKSLMPPEPMTAILFELSRFELDGVDEPRCLVVKHRRQPFPLYERLISSGWAYYCQVNSDDDITLYIFRKIDKTIFEEFMKNSKTYSKKGCEL